MELGFWAVLVLLYKTFAFIVLGMIGLASIFGPVFLSATIEHPLPLLLYVVTPLILTIVYKLMWFL